MGLKNSRISFILIIIISTTKGSYDVDEREIVERNLRELKGTFLKQYQDIISDSQKIIDDKIKANETARICIDENGRESMAKIDEASQILLYAIDDFEKRLIEIRNGSINLNLLKDQFKLNSEYDRNLQKIIYETQKSKNIFIKNFLNNIVQYC